MKWPRWIPRLLTVPVHDIEQVRRSPRIPTPVAERLGIRDVGQCEACGRPMQARTRRDEYRGRVDCDCGFRNHVEFREVRLNADLVRCHVTVTSGRRFESATHRPDLRLAWRYGICTSCIAAVRLVEARTIAHEDAAGMIETISYYCDRCHADDDVRRGRLLGHDGSQVIDVLRYQLPPGAR